MPGGLILSVAFGAALITALLLTPAVAAFARARGLVAAPRSDRWHKRPTALLGGVAIYAATIAGVLMVSLLDGWGFSSSTIRGPATGIVLAATLMFVTGLIDDRYGLRPTSKLILQAIGAAIIVTFDIVYPLTPWWPFNVLVTVFWFIAVTNAMNLIDNMDGVAAGVGGLAATFLGATFAFNGAWQLAAVCAALAGASFGFLRYNFHPASIFMGDSGSLVLGALIASLGAAFPATVSVGIVPVLFVPVFIAAIPILDTLLVTTTRTLAGRPVSVGGRDHTAHRLVVMGLSERQTTLLLYAGATVGGAVAFGLSRHGADVSVMVGLLFLTALGTLAAYLGRLHVYSPEAGRPTRRLTVLVSDLLHKRRAAEVLLDLALFAAAYYGAYLLRYDGALPAGQDQLLRQTLAVAIASKAVAFGAMGVYRSHWHHMSVSDIPRLLKSTALGSLLTVAVIVFLFRESDFSRGIFTIDAVLVLVLTVSARLSFRLFERIRARMETERIPVLVYGAGRAGELLVRDLTSSPGPGMWPVGFIDDDSTKRALTVHGVPVLGAVTELGQVARRVGARGVLVAAQQLGDAQRASLLEQAAQLGLGLFRFRCGLEVVELNHTADGAPEIRIA